MEWNATTPPPHNHPSPEVRLGSLCLRRPVRVPCPRVPQRRPRASHIHGARVHQLRGSGGGGGVAGAGVGGRGAQGSVGEELKGRERGGGGGGGGVG